jgi:hypothetical protein
MIFSEKTEFRLHTCWTPVRGLLMKTVGSDQFNRGSRLLLWRQWQRFCDSGEIRCVYRKPKPGRNDDEVRRVSRVN